MKVYIRAANIADIQAKIAKKQADIDKKYALIEKREAAIQKKLNLLSGTLTAEELSRTEAYLNAMKTTYRGKIPSDLYFDLIDLRRKYNLSYDDPRGKALYNIDEDAESIYNANSAISEAQAILDKYNGQLDAIKQKEKEVDEIPEVLKDFMNQLIDAWDEFDIDIRDRSPEFYKNCRAKMSEIIPRDLYGKDKLNKLFELYPKMAEHYEQADSWNKYYVERDVKEKFENEYLNIPFKKEFGVSVAQAKDLWNLSDDQIHAKNTEEGKRVILDLVKRVTKITGPITSWAGLHLTAGNGGWAVLNGVVVGESGKASVDTILAGGYHIQRLHARTLVKPIR